MKHKSLEPLIEQPQLSEQCPCGSEKPFGACCGRDVLCDCKSHLSAIDCCYAEGGKIWPLKQASIRRF